MSTRDKKFDDSGDDTPAAWVAKHIRGYRVPQSLRSSSFTTSTTSNATRSDSYQSAKYWRPKSAPLSDRKDKKLSHNRYADDEDDCSHLCDCEDGRGLPAIAASLPRSKPFRRMFMILLGIVALGYFCWRQAVGETQNPDWPVREAFLKSFRGTYGFAEGGEFEVTGGKAIATLEESLLPGGPADAAGERRLIFVGDIHGCKDELLALLKEVGFSEEKDHLIATGEVITKGPDSPGVIDELIRLNADSVRGNHEDRVLTLAGVKKDETINQAMEVTKASSEDSKLLKSLHKHHLQYLRRTPLILRVPSLPFASSLLTIQKHDAITSEVLVVHAGLVPAVPLKRQDPYFVMNMRSLGRKTHVPSSQPANKEAETRPWYELWNWYNERLSKREVLKGWHALGDLLAPGDEVQSRAGKVLEVFGVGRKRPHPQVVVYGHDSRAGLKDKPWSRGLDTGCVRGGELTALILDAYGNTQLVSVKCKKHK